MTYRELTRLIESDGWTLQRQRGSHRVYAHPTKPGRVILAGHSGGADVPPGLLQKILKEAGLK